MACSTPDCLAVDGIVRAWMKKSGLGIAWSVFEESGAEGVIVRLLPIGDARQRNFGTLEQNEITGWLEAELSR